MPSFVAQSFDGIEARGAESWHHAADQPHDAENERGRNQGCGSDDEADVAGFAVFGKSAVQGESSDRECDRVGENYSQYSADEGNGESFGEERQILSLTRKHWDRDETRPARSVWSFTWRLRDWNAVYGQLRNADKTPRIVACFLSVEQL